MTRVLEPAESPMHDALVGVAPEVYGESYRDHVLEIYKMYLEMTDRISGRRERANAFFLTVNAALIAVLAEDSTGTGAGLPMGVRLLVPLVAAVLCYLWYRIIRSYRDLNSAKFKVVHAIERNLPLKPYDAEWESVGRGRNPKLYLPFTHVEGIVPFLFMGFHGILLLARVPWRSLALLLKGTG